MMEKQKLKKLRFKIFHSTWRVYPLADELANEWLKDHPDIEIIDVKYQGNSSTHSICILYKE